MASAVAVTYFGEKQECTTVILACPSKTKLWLIDELGGCFLMCVSALSWFNEVRIIGVINFGKSLLSINTKTGYNSGSSSI
jgi:hypothetical protein